MTLTNIAYNDESKIPMIRSQKVLGTNKHESTLHSSRNDCPFGNCAYIDAMTFPQPFVRDLLEGLL